MSNNDRFFTVRLKPDEAAKSGGELEVQLRQSYREYGLYDEGAEVFEAEAKIFIQGGIQ